MELADRIDQKLRLGKSDALLLYVASLQTVVLTLSQLLLGSQALVYYPAILLFVAIMPIYIGYVRGAITRDSLVERTRGWLYLIFGTVMYLAVVLVWILGRVSIIVKGLQLVMFFSIGWLSARTVPAVGSRILNALGGSADQSALESFTRTGEAIMWMSFTLAFITATPDLLGSSIGVFGALLMIGLSLAAIWNAEKFARLSEKGYVQEKRKIRNGRLRWLGIVGLGVFLFGGIVLTIVEPADVRWKVGLLVVLVTGMAMVFASLVLSGELSRKVRLRGTKPMLYRS
jgi:lysylphosphatidylglycerol synthetase-like protein (DUF2156 family)